MAVIACHPLTIEAKLAFDNTLQRTYTEDINIKGWGVVVQRTDYVAHLSDAVFDRN